MPATIGRIWFCDLKPALLAVLYPFRLSAGIKSGDCIQTDMNLYQKHYLKSFLKKGTNSAASFA
jgi:hypothetical protein